MRLAILAVITVLATGCGTQDETPGAAVTGGEESVEAARGGEADTASAEYDSYGFRVDSLEVEEREVGRNESLYLILEGLGFTPQEIYAVSRKAEKHVDFTEFKPGQDYKVYREDPGERNPYASAGPPSGNISGEGRGPSVTGDNASAASTEKDGIVRLVWQPGMMEYVVFDFSDSLRVYRDSLEMRRETARATGTIETSLYESVTGQQISQVLAYKMAEVLAWEIDFFNLRDGDSYRVYYENRYVDNTYYGVGEILAVEFNHMGSTYQAYRFEEQPVEGYYDEEGNSVQKALLKAPFRYDQRVSSGFDPNRFHPVLRERRPHNGVDYAAPHGTPVLSTGDGTVTRARYAGANGNFVKIRHNGTYQTAYLHLSGFASGVREGSRVEQGQVIGYVGATGRVTGTHLHYQLYRNERPVNPLTIDLPSSESVPDSLMDEYEDRKERLEDTLFGADRPSYPAFTDE